jgi:hypothetical protein
MLDCLKCVHQFKEFVLRCFFHRTSKNVIPVWWNPILTVPKRMDKDPFYWFIEQFRTLSIWMKNSFWIEKKAFRNNLEHQRMGSYRLRKFLIVYEHTLNYRTRSSSKRQLSMFLWMRLLPFVLMNIFRWVVGKFVMFSLWLVIEPNSF